MAPLAVCIALLAGLIASLIGCSHPPHDVAPVSGTVTVDGRPLTRGKIMFAPLPSGDNQHPGKVAIGVLQPDGSFTLSTYGSGDGAVVGEHSVTVMDGPSSVANSGAAEAAGATRPPIPAFERIRAPGKYRVVAGQENHFDIQIMLRGPNRGNSHAGG